MSFMFKSDINLTSLNLDGMDTSAVTDMSYMFDNCSNLTKLDLSSFNTSKVKNMAAMFRYCNKLEALDLSNFTFNQLSVSSKYMYMFEGCKKLTSITTNSRAKSWIISHATDLLLTTSQINWTIV